MDESSAEIKPPEVEPIEVQYKKTKSTLKNCLNNIGVDPGKYGEVKTSILRTPDNREYHVDRTVTIDSTGLQPGDEIEISRGTESWSLLDMPGFSWRNILKYSKKNPDSTIAEEASYIAGPGQYNHAETDRRVEGSDVFEKFNKLIEDLKAAKTAGASERVGNKILRQLFRFFPGAVIKDIK